MKETIVKDIPNKRITTEQTHKQLLLKETFIHIFTGQAIQDICTTDQIHSC